MPQTDAATEQKQVFFLLLVYVRPAMQPGKEATDRNNRHFYLLLGNFFIREIGENSTTTYILVKPYTITLPALS